MTRLEQVIKNKNKPVLIGAAVSRYNPAFVEIIARLGYDSLWIEMEHQFITFAEAEDLCRVASGLGLLTMIRVADNRRENVLKAAECGPDIINLPMANTVETVKEFVRHAKYRPDGSRGFYGSSRALNYGIGADIADLQDQLNEKLCLMIQIETREAVANVVELCSVPGVDAVLIGPGDLSASFGVPGRTDDPRVLAAIEHAIDTAKLTGKTIAISTGPGNVGRWRCKGVSLVYVVGDIGCMRIGAQKAMEDTLRALEEG
ncbi:MAG: aldolase/citrate lyase family protein [Armatimonadota bacterium]|nr:aldolase/citrate lyase family protein [Armatimonadota bacterium]